MATQTVVWTALPNDYDPDSGKAKLSIAVSPRLVGDGSSASRRVSGYPAWTDWPNTLSGTTIEVKCSNGETRQAQIVSAPDSDIWRALFPGNTPVRDWEFDSARVVDNAILTAPAGLIAEMLEDLYTSEAVRGDDGLPVRAELRDRVRRRLGVEEISPESVIRTLRGEQKSQREGITGRYDRQARQQGIGASKNLALSVLRAYHTPLNAPRTAPNDPDNPDGFGPEGHPTHDHPRAGGKYRTHAKSPRPTPQDLRQQFDFHRIAGALGQFHFLSRACGLVIDLEFDPFTVTGANETVEVAVDWPKPGAVTTKPDVYPRTMSVLTSTAFHPARGANDVPVTGRYLQLSDELFKIIQMDVDGGGSKLANTLSNFNNELPRVYTDDTYNPEELPAEEAGLPSLRTSGLMLVESRRDVNIAATIDRNAAMESGLQGQGTPPTLYAEDLIKGLRLDVWEDQSQNWHPLCARKVRHTLLNGNVTLDELTEESMARLAAQHSGDGHNADVLKVHEALAIWSGWSLAAPEPGRIIQIDDTDMDPTFGPTKEPDEQVPPGMPLKTTYEAVPGTLPRLRYGWSYRMRARIVDLAGNSVEFSPSDVQPSSAVTSETMFRRYEPVEPPLPTLVRKNGTTMPLRPSEGTHQVVIRTLNDTPDKNTIPTTDRSERHIVPPRVTQRMAEAHSKLDTGQNGRLDPSWYPQLVELDQAIPHHPVQREAESESHMAAPVGFTLPYLPDPAAIAVFIRIIGAPGVDPNTPFRIPLYRSPNAAWPSAEPFRIVLIEDASIPACCNVESNDEQGTTATIALPKAVRARLLVSCEIDPSMRSFMAIENMIERARPPRKKRTELRELVAQGRHWMLTPWRTLEVIHAVQKPLIMPDLKRLTEQRFFGQTAARLLMRVPTPLHANSTGKVDLIGTWSEPVDDPVSPLTEAVDGRPAAAAQETVAFTRDIARDDAPEDRYPLQGEHDFQNTHYRRVTYRLDATTRYKEFMDKPVRTDPSALKITSAPKRLWIPNTAPPPPPDILYMVPTFGWAGGRDGDRTTSYRSGGGIRVYLARPWMVTGFTEMLGVVLADPSESFTNKERDDTYAAAMTQWGVDPTKASPGKITTAFPGRSAFPLAKRKGPIAFQGTAIPAVEGTDLPDRDFFTEGLPYPDTPQAAATDLPQPPANADIKLAVAPHEVGFDPDRQLWYADIVVKPPRQAYFPFIRMVFARYNPISAAGAHLSSLVTAAFQQLVPDRLVVVTRSSNGRSAHVAVYGSASNDQSVGVQTLPNQFSAETQVLDKGADPELGWRTVTVEPPATPPIMRAERRDLSNAFRQARSLNREATQLVEKGEFEVLQRRPELILALQPPLLWESDVPLPQAGDGEKRRLIVTENEQVFYAADDLGLKQDNPNPGRTVPVPIGSRVVYMETLEV
ncbi:MAG: hypothetical protein AAF830_09045 [Pseudomonadota bacterium]